MDLQKNANRFLGFADVYDRARPSCPPEICALAERYSGRHIDRVADLGCGTGLSARVWEGVARDIVGVDPNPDMLTIARQHTAHSPSFQWIQRFAHDTGLPSASFDAVVCSQSFHWMEPHATLQEVTRLRREGGVFLTVDADWPPVCDWQAERAYQTLFRQVRQLEQTHPVIKESFCRFPKEHHLENIQNSGHFRYVREVLLQHTEPGSADRLLTLALSQGGLQAILRHAPELILPQLQEFETFLRSHWGAREIPFTFCYRIRVGIQ